MVIRNIILVVFISLSLNACFFRKNNQYARDLTMMKKKEFAKKYYTLYNENVIDFSSVKKNEAYYVKKNGSSFQYLVFSEDNFVYATQHIPLSALNKKFSPIKLGRYCYFKISNNILKTEYLAATPGDVYPIIEEGDIKGNTIFMRERYNAKGFKNKQKLFDEYVLTPEIKVYKIGNDYFIEKKN